MHVFTSEVLFDMLKQDRKRQKIDRRRARRPAALAMDYDQTIIAGHMYQYWLQNSSDIVRERKRKVILVNALEYFIS